jgi:hypothetical protein
MDGSTLGQRFTILSITVMVHGCAIPIAWRVVGATRAGAWHPHWEALFGQFVGVVPSDWTVIVTADRGLYASCCLPPSRRLAGTRRSASIAKARIVLSERLRFDRSAAS